MSTKYITFKDIDHKKIIETYSLLLTVKTQEESVKKQVTNLNDLKAKPAEETVSFLDESKVLRKNIVTMYDFLSKGMIPETTTLNCFWCRHNFDNKPIGCPLKYCSSQYENKYFSEITKDNYIIRNNITKEKRKELEQISNSVVNQKEFYETDGIFCSFNCCLAFIEENKINSIYQNSTYLLIKIYIEIFDEVPENLTPAPSWRLLKNYGGVLDISEFRETFTKIVYKNNGIIKEIPTFKPVGWLYEKYSEKDN